MPVKKHSVEKIIAKLREIEKLTAHVDAHGGEEGGATDQTFYRCYRWRTRYGALKEEAKRLQRLEEVDAAERSS